MGLIHADITNNSNIKWDWQVKVYFFLSLSFEDMAVCSHIITLETEANGRFIIYRAICSSLWDSWPIIPCKMPSTHGIQFRLPLYFQKLFDELCESVTLPSISYIFHFISTNTILYTIISFLQIKCTIFLWFFKECVWYLLDGLTMTIFYQDLILFFFFYFL